jgi:hypothetical protein
VRTPTTTPFGSTFVDALSVAGAELSRSLPSVGATAVAPLMQVLADRDSMLRRAYTGGTHERPSPIVV